MDFDMAGMLGEFNVAITVCDTQGIILYMNERAVKTFEKYGGESLLGTNLLGCHPEPSKSKLKEMLEMGLKNVYTIEKAGIKKLIYQSPFFKDGIYSGFVELSLELPVELPNFIRS
jgi:transcriptional regulator with PAS, ATPase and Fis domain